jgi:hypothetical protein
MHEISLPTRRSFERVIVGPNGQNASISSSEGNLATGTPFIDFVPIGRHPTRIAPPLPRGPVVYPGLPIDFPIPPTTGPRGPIELPIQPSTGPRVPLAPFDRPIKKNPKKEETEIEVVEKESDTTQDEKSSGGWFDWLKRPSIPVPTGPFPSMGPFVPREHPLVDPVQHPFGDARDIRHLTPY